MRPSKPRGNGIAQAKTIPSEYPAYVDALPTDTVTVTDPTRPLSGLTFPLIGVTTKPRLGRVCVVWLYPGVERVILVTATALAGSAPPPPLPVASPSQASMPSCVW
ncbi:MAG: hypothetical protein ACRERE_45525 [Candidatus Entotheonellia bacterium]